MPRPTSTADTTCTDGATPADRAAALQWHWSRLPDLPPAALYAALVARQEVFVLEQECPFLDADGVDHDAWHLLGWVPAEDPQASVAAVSARLRRPAADLACYLRLVDPGRKFPEPSLGRVLTTSRYRGTGLGRRVMREGLARAAKVYPGAAIRIAAQQRLERFYFELGFRTASAPFDEDGIPHIEMLHPGSPVPAPR